MKIIVTGASGFLGREVCLAALRRGHEVLALRWFPRPGRPWRLQARAFDLCSEAALESLVLEEFPHAVVHCAALPTIETCLADPARAKVLNAEVPKKLAQLCFHLGAELVHLSTDTVFDGVAGNYQHTDHPKPLNLYGETKAAAEVEVLKFGREHAAVLRTSPIIGNSVTGDRGLHERLFVSWRDGRPTQPFTDEIRQPVEVSNLADVTIELCERSNLSGLYHWAGTEAMSRQRNRPADRPSLRTRCRPVRPSHFSRRRALGRRPPSGFEPATAPFGRQLPDSRPVFRGTAGAIARPSRK
jgi:dTDP-4-dehydrorhamnose reductase